MRDRRHDMAQTMRHCAYASLCCFDRFRATKMARRGTPYCGPLREQNSCQCEAYLSQSSAITDRIVTRAVSAIAELLVLFWKQYCPNKCIGDNTKAADRQSPNCIKNQNKIKYGEKQFSIMADEIITPCNVA